MYSTPRGSPFPPTYLTSCHITPNLPLQPTPFAHKHSLNKPIFTTNKSSYNNWCRNFVGQLGGGQDKTDSHTELQSSCLSVSLWKRLVETALSQIVVLLLCPALDLSEQPHTYSNTTYTHTHTKTGVGPFCHCGCTSSVDKAQSLSMKLQKSKNLLLFPPSAEGHTNTPTMCLCMCVGETETVRLLFIAQMWIPTLDKAQLMIRLH